MAERGRLAMLVAALLALAVQAFVVQTHVHLAPPAALRVASHAVAAQPAHHRPATPAPLDCPSCRLLAQAGDTLAAPPVALVPPLPTPAWTPRIPAAAAIAGGRSIGWRSRGPPMPPVTIRP